jgi:hypothetical protein
LLALLAIFIGSDSFAGNGRWVKVAGAWEPAPILVRDLEAELKPVIDKAAEVEGRKLRNWEDYVFQYQAQETKGRRYIFVNALCHVYPTRDLSKELVLVRDGGSCYFHAKYDPERRQYYDVVINGEA